ncbi:hypothetical protein [Kaistella sp. 97-N-M2]|uniref:hypothetical protein n=1 Tax=Kaistella sp. 97-N-M2 TaxID=2908645 RepID=UPI0038B3DA70
MRSRKKALHNGENSISVWPFFVLVVCFYVLRRFFKTGEFPFLDQNHFSVVFWIWGIILAVKAVKIFFFNSTWERKMLNRELNQTNHGKF